MDRSEKINVIAQFPSDLEKLVGDLTPQQLTATPIKDEWSIAQIVHHCSDSHINSYVRCKLIATEDQPTLKPYDETVWATFADATDSDLCATVSLLTGLHARWTTFWQNLGETDWSRTGYHPGDDRHVSLADQLDLYVAHCEAHINQIKRNLEAL